MIFDPFVKTRNTIGVNDDYITDVVDKLTIELHSKIEARTLKKLDIDILYRLVYLAYKEIATRTLPPTEVSQQVLVVQHCEDIEKIKHICEKLFPDEDFDGDSHFVPCLLDFVDRMKKEIDELRAYKAKEQEHLEKLVGSPTYKKVVEGSINPNFKTLEEKLP